MGKRKMFSCPIRKVALGVSVSITGILALTAICTSLVLEQRVGEERISVLLFVVLLFMSFVGGCLAGSGKERSAYMPLVAGAVLIAILLAAGMLLFEGETTGFWKNTGAVGIGSVVSCLFILLKSRKGSARKFRTR